MACVSDTKGQRANAEHQKADAKGSRLTQRPGGLMQSLREALEIFFVEQTCRISAFEETYYTRLISLLGESVWHPSCTQEKLLNNKTLRTAIPVFPSWVFLRTIVQK